MKESLAQLPTWNIFSNFTKRLYQLAASQKYVHHNVLFVVTFIVTCIVVCVLHWVEQIVSYVIYYLTLVHELRGRTSLGGRKLIGDNRRQHVQCIWR